MKILFLTLLDFSTYEEKGIYSDLCRAFIKHGHELYCISPSERRKGVETHFEENGRLLKLKIGNTQKTNIVEKGISTLRIESQFIAAVKKYFRDVHFDLIVYSTPPITLVGAIKYIKKRDRAQTYLLLKDIFPQNAVDLGMMRKNGVKALLYQYFRRKEKKLYAISDRIGCMSRANVDYVLKHNPEISADKVEVCPNSMEVRDFRLTFDERDAMRVKYGIPLDKTVFVYGGNLGKPQGIPFVIECLKTQEHNDRAFFLIVGDGTEYGKLASYIAEAKPQNVKLMQRLDRDDYDRMVAACDIGMIFLDHRFTIPNFPSRLLGYMQAGLPVFACTDPNTDLGQVIGDGGFGWWCESNDAKCFENCVERILDTDLEPMKQKGLDYLRRHYTTENSYHIIMNEME